MYLKIISLDHKINSSHIYIYICRRLPADKITYLINPAEMKVSTASAETLFNLRSN